MAGAADHDCERCPGRVKDAEMEACAVATSMLQAAVTGARYHVDDALILRVVRETLAEPHELISENALKELLESVRR